MLTVPAYAKINLTLEVMGRYDDGYHQIASVMQLIDLHDTLSFEAAEELRLSCDVRELCTEDNLILRAARLIQDACKIKRGSLISLQKRIPMDSGLGGGSSDAAATLRALNTLWDVNLTEEQLNSLASKLGADVAFFLGPGTALATGRGEVISPLPPPHESWVVLLKPDINVSQKTRKMYSQLQQKHWTNGVFAKRMVESLKTGGGIQPSLCYNVFEQVAFTFFPGIEGYRRAFEASGAPSVHLAGAGPTLYTVVPERAEAESIASRLQGEVYLARSL